MVKSSRSWRPWHWCSHSSRAACRRSISPRPCSAWWPVSSSSRARTCPSTPARSIWSLNSRWSSYCSTTPPPSDCPDSGRIRGSRARLLLIGFPLAVLATYLLTREMLPAIGVAGAWLLAAVDHPDRRRTRRTHCPESRGPHPRPARIECGERAQRRSGHPHRAAGPLGAGGRGGRLRTEHPAGRCGPGRTGSGVRHRGRPARGLGHGPQPGTRLEQPPRPRTGHRRRAPGAVRARRDRRRQRVHHGVRGRPGLRCGQHHARRGARDVRRASRSRRTCWASSCGSSPVASC